MNEVYEDYKEDYQDYMFELLEEHYSDKITSASDLYDMVWNDAECNGEIPIIDGDLVDEGLCYEMIKFWLAEKKEQSEDDSWDYRNGRSGYGY